jgi:hypothetical protein
MESSVGVKNGELFWERASDGEIHTNEGREPGFTMRAGEEVMLDPSPLLGVYRFDLRAATMRNDGRVVDLLSDQLALAVDEDRGVLLRAAVLVHGEELSSSDVVEIAFDEPIRPALFRPLR